MAKKERSGKADKHSDLSKIRHSASHILAEAVLNLYPDTKLAFGPATEDGFYYDFEFSSPVSDQDLGKLEKEINKILKEGRTFVASGKSIEEAKKWAAGVKQPYKLEQIEELAGRGDTELSFYTSAPFMDLCAGPHVEDTKEIGAIKLLSVAGAYWKGDEKNKQLTRIYGTAFATAHELDEYLVMMEEARRRDHRKLGKELDLFTFSDLVGPGLPLWTAKGTVLRNLLDDFVWSIRKEYDFQKVTIPHITKKDLYETSGHWEKFSEELFRIKTREGHEFAMKPMNCPHHTQIYSHVPRSYRDLPQRYCETTMCYRDEQTGELHGLSRVRSFTQDDSHVFCRYSQLEQEVDNVWNIIEKFYSRLGLKLEIRLSLHDPEKMDKYLGEPAKWPMVEDQLRKVIQAKDREFDEAIGEAAFYGPKIDFMAKDAIGRRWQVATIQLDFNMPDRFDLFCINESGEQERILMVHVAVMGSLERFLSIMIEHFAGDFPVWLAPVQAVVLPIGEGHTDYATKVMHELKAAGIRAEIDLSGNSIGKKIRESEMQKTPYMLVVGDKEAEAGTVAVRSREKDDMGAMETAKFISLIHDEVKA